MALCQISFDRFRGLFAASRIIFSKVLKDVVHEVIYVGRRLGAGKKGAWRLKRNFKASSAARNDLPTKRRADRLQLPGGSSPRPTREKPSVPSMLGSRWSGGNTTTFHSPF